MLISTLIRPAVLLMAASVLATAQGQAREMAPEWSPDGAWIAYTAEPTASTGDVWMTRSDGRVTRTGNIWKLNGRF